MAQAVEDDTPTLSQLLYTHEKLENLARGPVPYRLVDEMTGTARGLALEIGRAPAMSWTEFDRKLGVLLDDWEDAQLFLDTIREDVCRLALDRPVFAEVLR